MSSDDQTFDQIDSGAADCVPTQAGSIKKGGYCMLKGFPCKVTQYSTAKPGKHGSAKATIVGSDIFTNKKYEDTCPTACNVSVPIVNKHEMEVADVDDGEFVSLILQDGTLKTDLKIPDDEELHDELIDIFKRGQDENKTVLFTVLSACGQEKIISGRLKE